MKHFTTRKQLPKLLLLNLLPKSLTERKYLMNNVTMITMFIILGETWAQRMLLREQESYLS